MANEQKENGKREHQNDETTYAKWGLLLTVESCEL